MKQAAITRPKITRIDFALTSDLVVVNKIDDGTTARTAVVVDSSIKERAKLDEMLSWCEANGWSVRRYFPLGARAWKGQPRVIRTRDQIRKKHADLTNHPVDGLQLHALDLAYDC